MWLTRDVVRDDDEVKYKDLKGEKIMLQRTLQPTWQMMRMRW
jgi:hypothetical protein